MKKKIRVLHTQRYPKNWRDGRSDTQIRHIHTELERQRRDLEANAREMLFHRTTPTVAQVVH